MAIGKNNAGIVSSDCIVKEFTPVLLAANQLRKKIQIEDIKI
jgi:hypothetical protein